MSDRHELVLRASKRLLYALLSFTAIMLCMLFAALFKDSRAYIFPTVVLAGIIGALVSLQRRLKTLPLGDLRLIAESRVFYLLAPFSGGLLASVLYLLFLSGVLTGPLFPTFEVDPATATDAGFRKLLHMQSGDPQQYAKLLFWSFVAGFSEKFVVDIIGRFEQKSSDIADPNFRQLK